MTVATTATFPSLAWFHALQELMAQDPDRFRKLGFIDATVGIEVKADAGQSRDRTFALGFGAYTLDDVREVESPDAAAVQFTLSAPFSTWREMIENTHENGGADLKHTLNYLHFGRIDLVASDQLNADLFFRVNGSLQSFFDKAAEIETGFA